VFICRCRECDLIWTGTIGLSLTVNVAVRVPVVVGLKASEMPHVALAARVVLQLLTIKSPESVPPSTVIKATLVVCCWSPARALRVGPDSNDVSGAPIQAGAP
jgi:hypothetical protein